MYGIHARDFLMTLTLMQSHSGLADEQIKGWIISTTKEAMSI